MKQYFSVQVGELIKDSTVLSADGESPVIATIEDLSAKLDRSEAIDGFTHWEFDPSEMHSGKIEMSAMLSDGIDYFRPVVNGDPQGNWMSADGTVLLVWRAHEDGWSGDEDLSASRVKLHVTKTSELVNDGLDGVAPFAISGDSYLKSETSSAVEISLIDPRNAVFDFGNGNLSAFAWTGEITLLNIVDAGLFDGSWIKMPVNVTVGNGVTSIGESVFYGCSSLTSVTMPDSVTSIGDYAFLGCSSLMNMTIPDSVTSIGSMAFSSCSGLTSVTIGNGVNSIWEAAFYGCSGLKSVTIPDSVERILDSAFSDCSGLTSVTIDNGVKSIGDYAFLRCYSLTSVTIPDSVKSIGVSMFVGCSGLTSVIIGNNVESIGNYAFSRCGGLMSVTIPDSVTSIGNSAFYSCTNLTSIIVKGKTQSEAEALLADAQVPAGCAISTWNDASQEWVNNALSTATISADLLLKTSVFGSTANGELSIANATTTTAGVIMYTNNTGSTGSTIAATPNFVKQLLVGKSINGKSLSSDIILNASDVSALASSDISSSIGVYIDDLVDGSVPTGRSDLSVIKLSKEDYEHLVADADRSGQDLSANTLYVIDSNYIDAYGQQMKNVADATDLSDAVNLSLLCSAVNSIPLNDYWKKAETSSSTEINSAIDELCSNVQSWALGNFYLRSQTSSASEISSLGSSLGSRITGEQTTRKTNDTYLSSLISAKQDALSEAQLSAIDAVVDERATVVTYNDSSISSYSIVGELADGMIENKSNAVNVKIGNGMMNIGEEAFADCRALTSVTIGNSVTSIDDWAFLGCIALTSVDIPDSVTSIGSTAFNSCSGLESIVIPNRVTSIGANAFSGCSGLTSVTIGNGVTSIEGAAFYNCSGLTSVVIPESVTSIGVDAFVGCNSLTSVTIGNGVTSIGSYAFVECSSLTSIIIKGKSQAEAATLLADASDPSITKVIAIQVEHGNMVELEWQSLKSMKDLSLLKPGMQYRITDYAATTNGSASSTSAGNQFDVIVTADSASTLNENARAALHAGDTYFSNCSLQAWKLKYCLENDTGRFAWADASSGKGVVFWMQDEFGNEAPYDFKGIQFIAYGDSDNVHRYTFDSGSASNNIDTSLAGLSNLVYGNHIEEHVNNGAMQLNLIVFKGNGCYSNVFGVGCSSITFGVNCFSNAFGSNCSNSIFGNNCSTNSFGSSCFNILTGNDFSRNVINNYCSYIKFKNGSAYKDYVQYVTLESGNRYITLNLTGNSSSSAPYRNVTLKSGINNTNSVTTIPDATDGGLTFNTVFKPTGSQEISV